MSDPWDASTPSADEVGPDPADPQDPAELQSAGDLDEDEIGTDPLEGGMDPPERWSGVVEDRPTPSEQREGDTIDERVAEERADSDENGGTNKPLAESRLHELDESIDERATSEVADGAVSDEGSEPEPGVVVTGEQVESTGLAAATDEGAIADPISGASPEENTERVEDSGG